MELPKDWVWSTVGELFETITGTTPPKKDPDNYGGHIPFVKPPELNNSLIFQAEDGLSIKGSKLAKILPPYSLMISCIGVLGKTGMNLIPVAFNQQINAIIFPKYINPKYGFYYFQSTRPKELLNSLASATTIPIVNKSKFQKIEIPLPPISEQQRIVNKIEELFTNLDKGVESLNQAKSKLKIYRQAILKYAMEGKLTEKWREENKDKVEPASVLLEKIKEETNKTENYRNFPPIDISSLVMLPKGWEWERLGNLVSDKITKGSTPTSYGFSYVNKGIRFIKTENIDEKGNIQEKTDFIDSKTNNFLKRSQLKNRDLLFSIAGTIGRVGLVEKKDLPANTNQALAIIRCFWNLIENKYIFYVLRSSVVQNKASNSIVGVGRANVSLTDIGFFQVPIPPLEEQKIIVERIEKLFSLADYIEETANSKLEESKVLRQSILKKAFEGKLVPQDPNDEPAEVLLEKIKMEKSNKGKTIQEKLVQ